MSRNRLRPSSNECRLNTIVALTYLAEVPGLYKAVGYFGNTFNTEIAIKGYNYTTDLKPMIDRKSGREYFVGDTKGMWYPIEKYKNLPTKFHTFFEKAVLPAKQMHYTYHNKLYPGLALYRETVLLPQIKKFKNVHGGLGLYLNQTTRLNAGSIRTINNFFAQSWSLLSVLGLEKFRLRVVEKGYSNDIKLVSSIYDSVYILVRKDIDIIRWVIKILKPIMIEDYIEDQKIKLNFDLEISLDSWKDFVSLDDIEDLEEYLKS